MKRILSLLFTITIILNLAVVASADDPSWQKASDWAISELEKAKSLDLIPQILNDADLTQKVTREEFAEVSVKLYESLSGKSAEEATENPFSDTKNPQILKAYNLGITNGVTATTFAPSETLTREQASTMLARAYQSAYALEKLPDFEKNQTFADDDLISSWAKDSVYFMAAKGVISGVSATHFAPKPANDEDAARGYGSATREQSLILAVRICENLRTEPVTPVKKEDFVIGFIGGSLTRAGNSSWIIATREMFKKQYPDKNIITVCAGCDGTTSIYGAMRYQEDIAAFNPDVVFIEFAANDDYLTYDQSNMYMESMVRQSLKLKKVPAIIFLYAPQPLDKEEFIETEGETIAAKEEVAKAYGLTSINIYDYMYDYYLAECEKDSTLTFEKFISNYYSRSGSGFDVHGGYKFYAEAIKERFSEDFEGALTIPKNISTKTNSVVANYRYGSINAASPRIFFSKGNWTPTKFETNYSSRIKKDYIVGGNFPYKNLGSITTTTGGAKFKFQSTANADAFCISYQASTTGASAKVSVDGREVAEISTKSVYNANYQTSWIGLPKDGKMHDVLVEINPITSDANTFTFIDIIERFNK